MRKNRKKPPAKGIKGGDVLDTPVFCLSLTLLILVPVAFSPWVYFKYSLPKFVVLLVGSSILVLLMTIRASGSAREPANHVALFKPILVRIVCLYFIVVAISTAFGVAPLASLFGSNFNSMGLLTRACFLVIFLALIAGIGTSEKRLRVTVWAIMAAGGLTAIYAVAQSFGVEPFVSRSLYTFPSPEGPVVRVGAALGHSNYLGNFLLYTTPLSLGLAIVARRWLRVIAIATVVLSMIAIVSSGTRGAWLGIAVGLTLFAVLELKGAAAGISIRSHRAMLPAVLISTVLLVTIVALSPASRSVASRVRGLMAEGTSSSGRTLLWRDSLRMLPSLPLIGCGPEGFRKAFLAFKSEELARLNPRGNNESPHNAILDAAVSYGLAGAALYAAIIVSALVLLVRARRGAQSKNSRIVITGLLSSFAAVLAHNIFIFDQIATGLYFFAFVALAQAATNAAFGSERSEKSPKVQASLRSDREIAARVKAKPSRTRLSFAGSIAAAGSCLMVAASVWYSAGLLRSDIAYNQLWDPANPLDLEKLTALGGRITNSPLPTGAYDFLFARGVDSFVRQLAAAPNAASRLKPGGDLNGIRSQALALGIRHAENSIAGSLTPELNYSLLGSLALAAGDVDKLHYAANEAVRCDPNNYYARWLLAEAHLARGEREDAVREAEIALALNHVSPEAASVLARARGEGSP